jgi:Cu/Ag efflux pump CusA
VQLGHHARPADRADRLAAMIGAFFILDDPIFNGLAISLIFGILVSTVLTLVVIPVLYYALYRKQRMASREPPTDREPWHPT